MAFSKFKVSLLSAILSLSTASFAGFTDTECLNSAFETKVSHKAFPLGLMDSTLTIKKEGCVITIEHQKLKYMEKKWIIDVCRGPIHIKYGTGAIDVFKRIGDCKGTVTSKYCSHLNELELLLQDDGLIFAKGEKNNINDDHGRVYCSYMLTLSYLEKGMIFNRDQEYSNVLVHGLYRAEAMNPVGRPLLALPGPKKTVETNAIEAETVQMKEEQMKEEQNSSANSGNGNF